MPFWYWRNQEGRKRSNIRGQDRSKFFDIPGGQIKDPSLGNHYSLPFLPVTLYVSVLDTWKAFWVDKAPFLGPRLSPRVLLPELQRYKDTVRCVKLGAEVPQLPWTSTQTMIVRKLKTHYSGSFHWFRGTRVVPSPPWCPCMTSLGETLIFMSFSYRSNVWARTREHPFCMWQLSRFISSTDAQHHQRVKKVKLKVEHHSAKQ